jgi:hypothetical protein
VRTQETFPVVVLTLLLSASGAIAQTQLSPEKKKELRKFDPGDIVPETREDEPGARESKVGRGGTQSRRNARTSATAAPISAAVDSTAAIPPTAPAAKAPPSLRATPLIAPRGASASTQSAAIMNQSSEPVPPGAPAPAAHVNRSVRSTRLSLPIISLLISVILVALIAVAIKLKRELSKL